FFSLIALVAAKLTTSRLRLCPQSGYPLKTTKCSAKLKEAQIDQTTKCSAKLNHLNFCIKSNF
ncbi:MAG: hypothetical protein MK212_03690, partial [Saprospiraceae bacterium]|nr:hypothetical protein [Saprospiraceae bacterium]